MLALNATIEAHAPRSRQGVCGCRSEVKALARQVNVASNEIDARVHATQQDVERVQMAFGQIKKTLSNRLARCRNPSSGRGRADKTTQKIGEAFAKPRSIHRG